MSEDESRINVELLTSITDDLKSQQSGLHITSKREHDRIQNRIDSLNQCRRKLGIREKEVANAVSNLRSHLGTAGDIALVETPSTISSEGSVPKRASPLSRKRLTFREGEAATLDTNSHNASDVQMQTSHSTQLGPGMSLSVNCLSFCCKLYLLTQL